MGLFERWANWIFRTATGNEKRRRQLTPVIVFMFTLYVALFIVAAVFTDKWLNLPSIVFLPWTMIAGLVLLIPGSILYIWTGIDFVKSRGTPAPVNPPVTLISSGLYAYSRNPMVTGIYLCYFGLGFLIGSISLVVFYTPLFIIFMHYYLIKVEEKELELKFGQDYLDYKKRVARYLPALKRREQAVKS
jgi:protein-S-isoprenylcysteine O-methyltransferase Ste14